MRRPKNHDIFEPVGDRDEAFAFPPGETPNGWKRVRLPPEDWYEVILPDKFLHTRDDPEWY